MAYVPVPKDLTKIKSKIIFGLTKRQLICFGGGALIGVPLYFLTRNSIGSSPATIVMVVSMLPMFVLGLYEHNGLPLEKVLFNIVESTFLRSKERPYQTQNFYATLMQQDKSERKILQIEKQKKAHPKRKSANQNRHGSRVSSPRQSQKERMHLRARNHPL